MFRFLTKALILKENKILLLKRKENTFAAGMWDIPGGKLEFGENLEESLLREVYEETSLKIEIMGILNLSSGINNIEKKQYITSVYLCRAKSGNIKLNDEHSEYMWISKDQVQDNNLVYYVGEALRKLEVNENGNTIRQIS